MAQDRFQELQTGVVRLLALASNDPGFNTRCRQDPAKALRDVAGVELPAACSVRCVDAEPGEVLIPLPPWNRSGLEPGLSESQLEAVVGGTEGAVVEGAAEEGARLVPSGIEGFSRGMNPIEQTLSHGIGLDSCRPIAYTVYDGAIHYVADPVVVEARIAYTTVTAGAAGVIASIGHFTGWW